MATKTYCDLCKERVCFPKYQTISITMRVSSSKYGMFKRDIVICESCAAEKCGISRGGQLLPDVDPPTDGELLSGVIRTIVQDELARHGIE